jgi:hypothetical protein
LLLKLYSVSWPINKLIYPMMIDIHLSRLHYKKLNVSHLNKLHVDRLLNSFITFCYHIYLLAILPQSSHISQSSVYVIASVHVFADECRHFQQWIEQWID